MGMERFRIVPGVSWAPDSAGRRIDTVVDWERLESSRTGRWHEQVRRSSQPISIRKGPARN